MNESFLGLHFHLSATINAVGDIPLVPAMSSGSSSNCNSGKNFVLHWMNNKEMEFSLQAEKILEDLCRVAMAREDTTHLEMELAKMEGTPPTSTPAHRPTAVEESKSCFIHTIFGIVFD